MKVSRKSLIPMALLLGLSTTTAAQTTDSVVKKWNQLNKDYSIDTSKQAFCYRDQGVLKGRNEHTKVTIASVSKLITSLWAVESLGPDYKYPTKFFLSGKKLHIEGSLDPVFSKRKLFFLLAQLNTLGVTELEEITFDDGLRVYSKAEQYIGDVLNVTPARTAANLKDFWNTEGWVKLVPAYNEFVKATPKSVRDALNIPDSHTDLKMKVGSVKRVNENPLKESDKYLHLSPMLERYLKFLNIVSNNYIADQVFDKLGGEAGFDKYFASISTEMDPDHVSLREGYSEGEATVKMFTGSGLNTTRDGGRVDNFANCSMVTLLVERLNTLLTQDQVHISKVVAVPGTDGGTFRTRLQSPRLNKTFVAKTGTLYHTSAIAGLMFSKSGPVSFGVFHQLTGWKGNAKMVQNHIISELYDSLSIAEKFEYQGKFFFPAIDPLEKVNE